MKKRSKIIIARVIAVLMVFSILPFDMLTTTNMVMAQELGDNVEPGSGEETPGNTDSSNMEGSDNTDTSNGEGSGNADASNGEGSDNTDNSDAENPDSTDGDAQDEEDSETTPNEEGIEEASVEESEEETVVKKASTVRASGFSNVGGWFESIYAEIDGVEASDVTEVSYTGAMTGKLSDEDLKYLVRDYGSDGNNSVRIDIPGLKAGTYTLTVKVGVSTLTAPGITVSAYDRSGYAHFKYTEGVGAYNDDGTLKNNAIVLYVTDENKNKVELTVSGKTATGIGNILNSSSSKHNSIIKKLTEANTPLVVRFIGTVSDSGLYERAPFDVKNIAEINGLSAYASKDNGGSEEDNGHMARIQYGKDITLEGIGYDAVIDGWGFHYIAKTKDDGKSFEVRNLTFINTPEDAVGMEGSQTNETPPDLSASVERCWIHNNEFYRPQLINAVGSDGNGENDKNEGDGSVDFKRGQYFTCSYNYFERCHKTNLVGSGDTSLQFNLTYHHNHWYMCQSRGPLSRMANIHMYNNIVDMQTDYAQNTRANAYIFSEYNMFYACSDPQRVEGGAIKSYNDSISGVIWKKEKPGTIVKNKTDYVENECHFEARNIKYDKFDMDPALSYIPTGDYILEEDFTKLRKIIKSQAGVQDREPKSADELSASEYSVMPSDTTVNQITLPYDEAPGTNKVFAFSVDQMFDLEIEYSSGIGVLVNEAGENLLEGDGSVIKLPKGTYWIQSVNITAADAAKGLPATFNDITISKFKLTPNSSGEHDWKFNIIFDVGKGTAPVGLEDTTADAGAVIEIGDCTPPEGYIFKGWSVNGGNSTFKNEYTVKETDASDGGITIEAVYEAIKYTVKYDANGGTLPSDMKETVEASIEDILTLGTCIPPKKKKFLGWSIGGSDTLINGSYTVKAADADNDNIITVKAMYGASEVGSSHEGISIIGLEKSYDYTGAKITPAIGVVDYDIGDDGKILTPGVDYTVKYKDNKNVGTAKVTVTGKGNYAGKDTEKTFEIKAVDAKKAGLIDEGTELVDLKGAKIAKIDSVEYTGEEQHPDFTLTLKGKAEVTYTYDNGSYVIGEEQSDAGTPLAANVAVSNNINKGTATILITGKVPDGKTKATSVKKTFKITAVDLAKNESKVNVTATDGTYSVKGAAPGSLKVTYDGKELRKGIDYTVKYTGNKKATTSAKVVITGKGNYAKKFTGTGTTYEIKPLDMSELEVKAVNAYKDIKAGKVKATVLDGNGNILKPSQYTLNVYSDNSSGTEAYGPTIKLPEGKIYVEAVAKDTANLSGQTAKAEFNVAIAKNNIAKAKIVLNKDAETGKTITKIYNGEEQELKEKDLKVTITGITEPLRMGTDYVIAGYSNNVNKGTATAIIKGIGSYSGTKTIKFKIVGKNMAIDGDDGITWDDVTDVITSFMKKLVK